jgi:hypothetical protein
MLVITESEGSLPLFIGRESMTFERKFVHTSMVMSSSTNAQPRLRRVP